MAQGRLVAGRRADGLVRRQRTRGIYGAEHPDVRDYFCRLAGPVKVEGAHRHRRGPLLYRTCSCLLSVRNRCSKRPTPFTFRS